MDTITVGSDELTFRATGDLLAVDVRLPPGGGSRRRRADRRPT